MDNNGFLNGGIPNTNFNDENSFIDLDALGDFNACWGPSGDTINSLYTQIPDGSDNQCNAYWGASGDAINSSYSQIPDESDNLLNAFWGTSGDAINSSDSQIPDDSGSHFNAASDVHDDSGIFLDEDALLREFLNSDEFSSDLYPTAEPKETPGGPGNISSDTVEGPVNAGFDTHGAHSSVDNAQALRDASNVAHDSEQTAAPKNSKHVQWSPDVPPEPTISRSHKTQQRNSSVSGYDQNNSSQHRGDGVLHHHSTSPRQSNPVNSTGRPSEAPAETSRASIRRKVQFDLDFDPKTMTYEELAAKGSEYLDDLHKKYGHLLLEWLYRPDVTDDPVPAPQQPNPRSQQPTVPSQQPSQPPQPIYPEYQGHFTTSEEAKTHRKRSRYDPKKAADLERVKKHGRYYWVKRIYDSMIDISSIVDSEASIHRQRFCETRMFDSKDLEAAAHHIFDAALAVHERGWNRPVVYHKKVVRGKLSDISEHCLERRLARICMRLKASKATVDDAVRGGVTLALLCDNPEARGMTKLSNNSGNKKRGERLKMVPKKSSKSDDKQADDGEDGASADADAEQ